MTKDPDKITLHGLVEVTDYFIARAMDFINSHSRKVVFQGTSSNMLPKYDQNC